ncbi:hypothetical protein DM02DRAFT_203895 [Periconia macrospinosa]|uniref:Uncharacterized protein n=1 Tax=Periconia macrospinosa TaxID=97972 RepID=A0A2V1DA91_9PLEO|nr:hypothetical protein DM02DRAFT_203895 [Periconia macrospinosa]
MPALVLGSFCALHSGILGGLKKEKFTISFGCMVVSDHVVDSLTTLSGSILFSFSGMELQQAKAGTLPPIVQGNPLCKDAGECVSTPLIACFTLTTRS